MKKIEPGDPETRTVDSVVENLDRLRDLFPDAFPEGMIDFAVLKQLLGGALDDQEERFGLQWHGKKAARQIALTPSTGTLRPCPEESLDWNNTRNPFIEGDNLEVLKLLQKGYSGKVKLIYIDPPYNTGSDFVYPDNFQDNIKNYLELTGQVDDEGRKLGTNTETSGRFHTAWLNMMLPRMKIARLLLAEDGVLLMSIDDREVANARAICNEVFGEENFIACMVWEKGRKNDAKFVSVGHEYILVYARSQAYLRSRGTLWREEKPGAREIWEKYLELRAAHGQDNKAIEAHLALWYVSLPNSHPSKKWARYKRVDANGPWRDRDISWPGGGGPAYDVIHPKTGKPCSVPEAGWRFSSPEEMKRQIALGLVEFRDDETEPPFRKAYIRPVRLGVEDEEPEEEPLNGEGNGESEEEFANQVRGTYFYKQSQVTVKYLRNLLGAKVFNNPKDHVELARLFDYFTSGDPSAIIVDFFAGSGSSGHAVMDLNRKDGGNRCYLLVQFPEPLDPTKKEQKSAAAYCDKLGKPRSLAEITKERLRRASGEAVSGAKTGVDLGFRVFKLASSNISVWDPQPADVEAALLTAVANLKPDRSELDLLTELLIKLGLVLTEPVATRDIAGKTVYSVGYGTLMACFAKEISRTDAEPLALGIVAWRKELAPSGGGADSGKKTIDRDAATLVFRDSAFIDDVAKSNLAAILQQYGLENVRSL